MTALECAFELLKCSPIGNPENSSKYGRAAHILSEHCQGKEDVSEAAMRIFAERIAELERELAEAREERDKLQVMRKEVVAANKGAKINAQVSNSLAGKLNQAERELAEAREWQNVKVTKNGETHCLGTLIELLERELAEARERERVAITSWDEERQRALREGERVLEAMTVANELAIAARRCLGWHDHESGETVEKIANALQRWSELKEDAK